MNDLNSIFKLAKKLKDNKPPDEFVDLLINQPSSSKKEFFKINRRILVMTALFSAISILSFVFYMNNDNIDTHVLNDKDSLENLKVNSLPVEISEIITMTNENILEDTIKSNKTQNYLRKDMKKDETSEFNIIQKKNNVNFIDPNSIEDDSEGYPIPGIITLELSREELKKLSINFDEDLITWKMEKYVQIHPIPFRNNPNYWKNTEIEEFVNLGYPVNGDTILIKNNLKINLNLEENLDLFKNYGKQSRMHYGRNDSIRKNVFGKIGNELIMMQYYSIDTIDGKERFSLNEKIISAPDSSLLFMDKNEYFKLSEKYQYQGFTTIPQRYSGWRKENYDLSLPFIAAIKYRKSGKVKEIFYRDSPIYQSINYKIDYSKLIPIMISFDNKIVDRVVFWFYPNDEFISKLPQRYKNILSKEVNLLLNSNNNTENNCDELGGETFLDYCRSRNSSMLISSINPNPAIDFANLKFEIMEKSIIEISIHDSDGKFIGRLFEFKEYQKGSNDVKVNLSGLKNGLYLISIKNKNNEFVSKRLIINK